MRNAIASSEMELGKMSDEQLQIFVDINDGKITFEEAKKQILQKYIQKD